MGLLAHGFVQIALFVAILMAISSAFVGTPLVLKRYSFMGFALSNVSFMFMAFSMVIINLNNSLAIVMPLTVLASILLLGFGGKLKVKGDAALAMISVGALAIGFFIINSFPLDAGTALTDIIDSLFGGDRIYDLVWNDVWISLSITVVVAALFIFFHNKVFASTFDENFMQATGQKPAIYRLVMAVIVGVVISLSMQYVGSLLTFALIIFPTLSSMRIARSYKKVTIFSVAIAAFCAMIGVFMAISLPFGPPPAATIIVVNIIVFGVMWLVGFILRKKSPKFLT